MAEDFDWIIESLEANANSKVIYQPTQNYHSEILDFFCTVTLESCNEIPTVNKPEGVELMTQSEISANWNQATAQSDKKILTLEYINRNGKIAKSTEFVVMRVTPSYTENLKLYLTDRQTVIMPRGCQVKASVRAYNCGLLQGTDKIDFRLTVREFNNLDLDQLATKYL